ncbi:MAG: hypothetical protein JO030_01890, partial [Candidatus Eremiobacteraeota bacterium]|nr:hypothetical protein [Candidatus Eremiobacteraeota bacterium]
GALPLAEVFEERVAGRFGPGTTTADLRRRRWFSLSRRVVKATALREPYRREALVETRENVERDLARMEDIVRRGGTFYLTPEGKYSVDGRIGPMRGVVERLAPLSTVYLAGVSYDPFVSKRFSMLYRIARFGTVADGAAMTAMTRTLAAIRPIVTSQVLSAWLLSHGGSFTEDDAVLAVQSALKGLPGGVFVDPELRRDPARLVRKSLPLLVSWKILERDGERYRLAAERLHPQFPFVNDIVAHQTAFLEETLSNAAYARRQA